MLSVAFSQAKYYTDNLRENILQKIRQKLRHGKLPAKAPLKYFNKPKLHTIKPNKKTFGKIKQILELFAKRNHTLTNIQNKMFSLGLVGKNKKPFNLSSVQPILSNPFYYGMFVYRDKLIQNSHKPMISKKLFDKIQLTIKENSKPRQTKLKKELIFKNFAICEKYGYQITDERHIKKSKLTYHYYRYTKKSKVKKYLNPFLPKSELADQILSYCQKVSIPDEWRNKFLNKIAT